VRERRASLFETVRVGSCEDKGKRQAMEDVHGHILWKLCSSGDHEATDKKCKRVKRELDGFNRTVSYFVICDGHGGKCAADYVYDHLFDTILKQKTFFLDPKIAIGLAFKEVDEEFLAFAAEHELESGTTVTLALIIGSTMYVANVGDSEAVLCSGGKASVLTRKHTLSNHEELKRVEELGGVIVGPTHNKRLGHPVLNSSIINIGVTRAIGDPTFKTEEWVKEKKSGLIAEPDVSVRKLTSEDQFMLIASDGFWDAVSPQEAVDYVLAHERESCDSLCKDLVGLSKKNSADNITVLLIRFNADELPEEAT